MKKKPEMGLNISCNSYELSPHLSFSPPESESPGSLTIVKNMASSLLHSQHPPYCSATSHPQAVILKDKQ